MTDNKTLILKTFEELKGQFVITDSHNIERLVAIGEDESDYYWITYDGRRLQWSSCVGRVMPLKGYLRNTDYNELVRLAELNHYDQPRLYGNKDLEKFKDLNDRHKESVIKLGENDSLLTPICWDLHYDLLPN